MGSLPQGDRVCTERDQGRGEGSRDSGPGDKRGYKMFGKEENVWMSQGGGSLPCRNRVPCFSGNRAERAALPEKAFQVACFGVQE